MLEDLDLLTTEEMAKVLGVNDSRVRQLCRAGSIPGAVRLGGYKGQWVIEREKLESYKASLPEKRRGWPAGKKRPKKDTPPSPAPEPEGSPDDPSNS